MKAVLVNMDQKEPDKATQPLISFNKFAPLQISSKTVDSIIRSKAFILTRIDFQYVGG